jgi:hypothetical protein
MRAIMQHCSVQRDHGVEANARLTAHAGVVLLLPLLALRLSLRIRLAACTPCVRVALAAGGAHPLGQDRTAELALDDWRNHLRGTLTRRGLAIASLLVGIALAAALLPYPSPFSAVGGG